MIDSSGDTHDAVSFSSWGLTITVSQTAVSTSTSLSSSSTGDTSFTSAPNNSVTLTASVTSGNGTPTGTVEFLDGNTAIAGCGAVALSGGTAHCTTAFTTEGIQTLTANYTASGGSFTNSSTTSPLYQYVKNHSTYSNGSYCNTGVITLTGNANGNGTNPYPSVINVGTDTPAISSSVSTVSVTLKNLSTSAGGSQDIHALLVAPDNTHNLDFMSGAGDRDSQAAVTDTWTDSGTTPPSNTGTPLTSTNYQAFSDDTSGNAFVTSTSPAPAVPSSIVFASPGGGTSSKNFEEAFTGAPSDGDWKLFIVDDEGSGYNATISGGWCIQITQGSGTATSTTVTSSINPAISAPVTITATIRSANNSALVSEGSVTFTENGQPVAGGPTSPVAVGSNGTASFSTSTLPQGDHTITASYNDSSSTYNLSFGTLIQRVDNATPSPTVNANNGNPIYSYCNNGAIQIPGPTNPTDQGSGYPDPSNIFVSSLPGQTRDVSVTLNNFSHLDPALVTSLLVGPGSSATQNLDFFSGAGGTPGTDIPVTLTFSDHASAHAPEANFTTGTYTYLPTSYTTGDTFTSDQAGFYTAPTESQVQYAGPSGNHTLDGIFVAPGLNSNGTWSLYFNQTSGSAGGSVGGGWCMNFTETLPALAIAKTATTSGSMTQGQTGFEYQIVVSDSGSGPTGGTVSVTDTPSSGLTITGMSGTGWTCTAPTCTRTDSIVQSASYDPITVTVSVASNATSPQTNYATVTNSGAYNSPLKSGTVSKLVLQSTITAASNISVPYSPSAQNVTLNATVTSGGSGINSGTVSFSVAGINGGASVTSGTVTSGAASRSNQRAGRNSFRLLRYNRDL